MTTGFVFHEKYLWHDTGTWALVLQPGTWVEPYRHIENADSKRRLCNLLAVSGLADRLIRIEPRPATDEEVLRVHTRAYLEKVKSLSNAGGGDAGMNALVGNQGYDIIALAAGGAIAAVDAVLTRRVDNAYALIRPPGHHAEPDMGMGFCVLANGAIAAHHALAGHGLQRIAFVDWDVHHGNGTQAAFYADPRVLTMSIHQHGMFPIGRGGFEEQGEGAGLGYNLDTPLPPGCGECAYLAAFDRIVLPALHAFRPELIIVPCGFDAGATDPLGRMLLYGESFRALARRVMTAAREFCSGRLVLIHEGGYCPAAVPFYGLAVIEEISGIKTDVIDPLAERLGANPFQRLQPHQEAMIADLAPLAAEVRTRHWRRQTGADV